MIGLRRDVAQEHAGVEAEVRDVVLAHRELDQLGRHRLALEVDEVRAPAIGPLRELDAVGDRGLAGRHVEADVEARLVARVVVGRQEQVRPVRLGRCRRAGRVEEERGGGESSELATVGAATKCETVTRNGAPLLQRAPRRDHEFLAVARERGRLPVDADAADAVAGEVEVEAAQVLRRPGQDRDRAVNRLRRRAVA